MTDETKEVHEVHSEHHHEHHHAQIHESSENWYDRYHKLLLIIPLILFLTSVSYLIIFYNHNGDIMHKDVTLTGGTSITVYSENISISFLESALNKKFNDVVVRSLTNVNTGKTIAVSIDSSAKPDELKQEIESFLGYTLDEKNSSIEFTGDSLSKSFYNELLVAILKAFIFMSAVIFVLFGPSTKLKVIISLIALIPLLFSLPFYILILILFVLFGMSLTFSISSFYVIICAFCDIMIPLAVIDLMGVRISTAGIAAFLMLIGYSVDTDILLTTVVLKRKDEGLLNHRILGAMKTGLTMTITALVAVLTAYFVVISPTLKQVFLILSIGLVVDIIFTWLMNASLLKWYCEKKGYK